MAIGQLSVHKKKWIPLVHVFRIFLFFIGNSYFLLFCALHFIGIASANLNLGKKRVTSFSIPPIVNIFSDFFCSLCFYSFHILRWDLLRLFGEANGRDTFFRILNYEKKTLYFLKFFFEILKRFLWTPMIYGFWCASKVYFFCCVFRVFSVSIRVFCNFCMQKNTYRVHLIFMIFLIILSN